VRWYNFDHHHCSIRYFSPAQRHAGDDHAIFAGSAYVICMNAATTALTRAGVQPARLVNVLPAATP
jgi:hypothetical protein